MQKVIGLGAGGHAKVVIDILLLAGDYEIVGLLDPNNELWGKELLGFPVLGDDSLLAELNRKGIQQAFIGLGGVGDMRPRRDLYEKARRERFRFVSAIHPTAALASSSSIGEGPTVMAMAVINAAASIGDNVIINTGAVVEHDCTIGDHAHISPGAVLASSVAIGSGAHVGANSTVRQHLSIGDGAVVGAGAVVVDDVPDAVVVAGVPARIIKRIIS